MTAKYKNYSVTPVVTDLVSCIDEQADLLRQKNVHKQHKKIPLTISYMKKTHGPLRKGGIGYFDAHNVAATVHVAPSATQVPKLVAELLSWACKSDDQHPLIKSCVFFHEFMQIYPFDRGNETIARKWQAHIIEAWHPIFAKLPIAFWLEKVAKPTSCEEYVCDALTLIYNALQELLSAEQVCKNYQHATKQATEQVQKLLAALGGDTLSTKEMLDRMKLRHRQAFVATYLHPALELGFVEMTMPDKPKSSKQKYRIVT